MNPALYKAALERISGLFGEDATGHDVHHTLRVYRMAMRLAEAEGADRELVGLAAMLHDADDPKLFGNGGGLPNARAFMEEHGVLPAQTEAVCTIIGEVSFSKNGSKRPLTVEGMVVQDADRLDAIGAIGIARTFAFGGNRGQAIHDPDRDTGTSIAHFHEKLLKLKDLMNTDEARRIAEERHRYMEAFLAEFHDEWNGHR
ncbi:HD domain-containing protein [Bhargavaea ginsengi]|uniref:HD domain-containing protein n=1 Tax=Bhargavaea ginsengi TaxID=426757 RepID=UPI00203F5B0A|nr:HD domain-containing protein [Bhargavaea ginsengi]MCM3086801.1 HD domain-containing protein [Bhargavaea ginsengi]